MLNAADQTLISDLTGAPSSAQRRALAKIITLLESTRLDHRKRADEVLNALLPRTGKSFRLGISGVPGVGKSTLIETLGLYLIEKGHRVAVLAIDPSSTLSGGSILGDRGARGEGVLPSPRLLYAVMVRVGLDPQRP